MIDYPIPGSPTYWMGEMVLIHQLLCIARFKNTILKSMHFLYKIMHQISTEVIHN